MKNKNHKQTMAELNELIAAITAETLKRALINVLQMKYNIEE